MASRAAGGAGHGSSRWGGQAHGLESPCHGEVEKGDAPPSWDCQAGWKMGLDLVALTLPTGLAVRALRPFFSEEHGDRTSG